MPELPDISVYIEALSDRTRGRVLEEVRIGGPSLLRTVDPPLPATHGKKVLELRRMGKRIVFALEDDLFLVIHLMVAGRLHWKRGGKLLADRALSRLLKQDWPRSLEELEARTSAHRANSEPG